MHHGAQSQTLFATPVVRGEAGVCYFWVRDMNARVEANRFPERAAYMQVAHGPCPRQDDARYIENGNVPDGIFAELAQRWSASGLPGHRGFVFPALTADDRKFGVVDFAALLATPQGHKRLSMVSMEAGSFAPDSIFPSGSRTAAIDIVVSDSREPSMIYYLVVDWLDGEFRVVKLNAIMSGC